jgi:hypothetical protein
VNKTLLILGHKSWRKLEVLWKQESIKKNIEVLWSCPVHDENIKGRSYEKPQGGQYNSLGQRKQDRNIPWGILMHVVHD